MSTTTLTIRSREDILAAAPVVMGFKPQRSVVMMAFGPATFHARVDAPIDQRDLGGVVDALLDPVIRHGVQRVVFALYDLPWQPEHVVSTLKARFGEHVDVPDIVLATQTEYQDIDGTWVSYDTSTNALNAQGVLEGRVVHGSREEMAAALEPGRYTLDAIDRAPDPEDGAFMVSTMSTLTIMNDDDLARFVANLGDNRLRDTVTGSLTGDRTQQQVDFWVDVLRRTPVGHRTHPAAELALAAWVAGNGALAWCALDNSPKSSGLGGIVTTLLMNAIPPSTWEDLRNQLSGAADEVHEQPDHAEVIR